MFSVASEGGSDSSMIIASDCVSVTTSRFLGRGFLVVVVVVCANFEDAVMISGSGCVSGISSWIVRGLPLLALGFVSSSTFLLSITIVAFATGFDTLDMAALSKPLSSDRISKSSSTSSVSLAALVFVISFSGFRLLPAAFLPAPGAAVFATRPVCCLAAVALVVPFGLPGLRFTAAGSIDSGIVTQGGV